MKHWSVIFLILGISTFVNAETYHREQFDYNWYAARQSLEEKLYSKALIQFLFCEQINPHDGKTKDYLGILFISLHDTALAYSYFKQAYKYDPKGSWRNYATLLFNVLNEREEAIRIVEKVVKQEPKNDKVCTELLNMYTNTEKYDKALKLIEHIEQIQDPNENTLFEKCRIYCLQKKEKKAIEQINTFLTTNISLRLLEMKIIILRSLKTVKWEKLNNAYSDYFNINPTNLPIQNDYAWDLAFLHHDLVKAEQISTSLVEREPNNPLFLDTYAMILYLKKQNNLAIFYISKAYDLIKNVKDIQIVERIKKHYNFLKKRDE